MGPNKLLMFAIVDAIESDQRQFIVDTIIDQGHELILTSDELAKTQSRLSNLSREGEYDLENPSHLLFGLDFYEKTQVILRHKHLLGEGAARQFVAFAKVLSGLVSVRNDVAHGRPVDYEDAMKMFESAKKLAELPAYWPKLSSVLLIFRTKPHELVKEDYFVIETLPSKIWHNLPEVEHSDTGFYGRVKEREKLRNIIFGRNPVVTVVGTGGFGKTSLTVQVLYDILRDGAGEFEGILWVTAKSNKLDISGITPIKGAAISSNELFSQAIAEFGEVNDKPSDRLLKLATENNIIVVIDNLETVLDVELRGFAKEFQMLPRSKLVFTSRIPLSEGDLPFEIQSFSNKEAMGFLRKLIDTYDIGGLDKNDGESLKKYCTRLACSPLFLKWFALGVKQGMDPRKLASNPEVALEFCLENVFSALTKNGQKVSELLSQFPALSKAVICHLLEMEEIDGEKAMSELISFNLISVSTDQGSGDVLFSLFPISHSYIARKKSRSLVVGEEMLSKYRKLIQDFDRMSTDSELRKYWIRHIHVYSKEDPLAFPSLHKALSLSRNRKVDEALEVIQGLKLKYPTYSEIYRIEALIFFDAGRVTEANMSYTRALDLNENSPESHYFYAGFALKALADPDLAIKHLKIALELDSDSASVHSLIARAYSKISAFSEAREHIEISRKNAIGNKEKKVAVYYAALIISDYVKYIQVKSDYSKAEELLSFMEGVLKWSELNLMDLRARAILEDSIGQLCTMQAFSDDSSLERVKGISGHLSRPVESVGVADRQQLIGYAVTRHLERGYTFLTPEGEETGYFVHANEVSDEIWGALCGGARCIFEGTVAADGRKQAFNVRVLN